MRTHYHWQISVLEMGEKTSKSKDWPDLMEFSLETLSIKGVEVLLAPCNVYQFQKIYSSEQFYRELSKRITSNKIIMSILCVFEFHIRILYCVQGKYDFFFSKTTGFGIVFIYKQKRN